MSENSFDRINYYLRPSKQVERKILIDILLHFRQYVNLNDFSYVGMGSVYYYDFIMIHKLLGLKKLISFDSKKTIKRFEFNKPYDFVKFEPMFSTDYLYSHPWNQLNTITWLDYDGTFHDNIDSIISDITILAQNCNNHDIAFLTINCFAPKKAETRKQFLETYQKYISLRYQNVTSFSDEAFPYLIQNIMNNIFINENLYSPNKYNKICSFWYRDGAPMYTLGGFFTSDSSILTPIQSMHEYISFDQDFIHKILIPHITYKEKHYLDNNIVQIQKWLDEYSALVPLVEPDGTLHEGMIQKYLNQEMDFELSLKQITDYLQHYRFMPQYFEGLI